MVETLSTLGGRVRRRRPEPTVAAQVLLLQLLVVGAVLFFVAVLSLRQSTADFTESRGAKLHSVAEYLAALDPVRTELAARGPAVSQDSTRQALAPFVERGVKFSGAHDVLIVRPNGVVAAASDPSRVGRRAELGASDAMQGRSWSGDVEVDGERAVAAHAPVLHGQTGELIGLVVAEDVYPTVTERLTGAAPDLALFLGIGALLGIAGTYGVSRVVRHSTRGLSATELANLADQREALLHAIREGVVGVGTDRRVTVMNDAARETLGLADPSPVGRRVDDLGLDPHVVALLTGEDEGNAVDAVALVGTRVVVFNRREARTHGRGIGSVTTLRDRTEMLSLQSQLSSNLTITDTLRAQTHEFSNQLHTISGLVQLGEYDEVTALVGTLTRQRAEVSDRVTQRLLDPAVAALVVAKHAVAEERGVHLELDPGSRLPALAPDEVADLTTVIGNLVDNAVDACAGRAGAYVEVWVFVDRGAVHLRVRDNGPGVPEELREAIFVRGYSTKPEVLGGRGIGLPLVRLICSQRGGRVAVDATRGGGAEFGVVLPIDTAVQEDAAP